MGGVFFRHALAAKGMSGIAGALYLASADHQVCGGVSFAVK
jgi:hypothetical protein